MSTEVHRSGLLPTNRNKGRKLLGHLYALQGAFLQRWRVTASRYQILLVGISQVPTAAAAAWIARASAEQGISLAIAVGASFVVVWNVCVFRTGFSLLDERWAGTLELNLLSRSPLTLVMLGKSLAFVVFFAMVGLLSLDGLNKGAGGALLAGRGRRVRDWAPSEGGSAGGWLPPWYVQTAGERRGHTAPLLRRVAVLR